MLNNPFQFGPLNPSGELIQEAAQDAIGAMVANSARVTLTYVDGVPTLTADLVTGSVTYAYLQDVSAASRVLGRGSAGGSGDVEELTLGASLVMNGTSVERAALTGDVTAAQNSNTTTIANDAVTFAKMQNSAVAGLSVVGRSTNSAGDFAEIAASADGQVLRRGSSSSLAFGTLLSSSFADGTIVAARMSATATQRLFGRNTSGAGNGEEVTLSQVLDWAGATNGFVLYRTGGAWTANTPNNAGLVDLSTAQTITALKTVSGLQTPVVWAWSDNTSAQGPVAVLRKTSTAAAANDQLGALYFQGSDNAPSHNHVYAAVGTNIIDATSSSKDGEIYLGTMVNNSFAARFRVRNGAFMTGATGGDQGANTINASAVYDDGVLLTCMPFNPEMGQREWNAQVVKGEKFRHTVTLSDQEPESSKPVSRLLWRLTGGLIGGQVVRKVVSEAVTGGENITSKRHFRMLEEGFDPHDPENYIARLEADKALPALLTQEEWRARMIDDGIVDKVSHSEIAERTVLAMDYLACAWRGAYRAQKAKNEELEARLAALEDRLAALEGRT